MDTARISEAKEFVKTQVERVGNFVPSAATVKAFASHPATLGVAGATALTVCALIAYKVFQIVQARQEAARAVQDQARTPESVEV